MQRRFCAFDPGFFAKKKQKIFFHPDYTVGAGITPAQSSSWQEPKSRAIPPVGN
jgi:hypothetical protein